jgi:Ca2+-dependent lipid-binding protein
MLVLPNRLLVKLDSSNDYFKTYQPSLGVIRVTIERAIGIAGPKKSGVKSLFHKIVKDIPDCYCKVTVGAEEQWRTTTKNNDRDPVWNETHDFLVSDFEQNIFLDVQDSDADADDDIGEGHISVKNILLGGGSKEVALTHNGQQTNARVMVHAKFFHFNSEASALSAAHSQGEGQLCGLATVLVANVSNLQGNRDELNPSVKVSWGGKNFQTAAKTYSPGTDIFNPSFDQAFRIPITRKMIGNPTNFRISVLNKTAETGAVEVPFDAVLNAPKLSVSDAYNVGSGVSVRVAISLRGLQPSE